MFGLSDTVVIALISGIVTTVTTVVGAILTYLTRKQVKKLRAEIATEAETTTAYAQAFLEIAARHPDDLPSLNLPESLTRRAESGE